MKLGIAGGGLMGRLLAWQLLRQGHAVTVFDAGSADGEDSAAYVAAAMLAPYSEAVTSGAEMFALGKPAVDQWRELLTALAGDSEREVELQARGSVVVAHELDLANLRHFSQQLRAVVADDPRVHSLDRLGLKELEPDLPASFRQGLWLEGEGALDNRALLRALHEAIVARGGDWRAQQPVTGVAPGRLTDAGGEQRFDWVVDCRGLGAKADWAGLRGVRGEILWVHAPEVALSRPLRLMHPRYHLYITPKPGDIYVVGATEIESESAAPVTVRSQLELLSALYSVHSGFAEARIAGSFARCRPALPDNLPRVRVTPGLLQVNGLYRHGYLLAPTLLDAALAALQDKTESRFVEVLDRHDRDQRKQSTPTD